MRFRIVRNKQDDYATFATMFDEAQSQVGVIIERPFVDVDNNGVRDPNVCRIQHGTYRAVKAVSPKRRYPVWWLCDVPDVTPAYLPHEPSATTCQLHVANFPWDLNGCLGIGTAFGDILYRGPDVEDGPHTRRDGAMYPGVSASGTAFDKFMDLTDAEQEIWLEIVDKFNAPAGTWA